MFLATTLKVWAAGKVFREASCSSKRPSKAASYSSSAAALRPDVAASRATTRAISSSSTACGTSLDHSTDGSSRGSLACLLRVPAAGTDPQALTSVPGSLPTGARVVGCHQGNGLRVAPALHPALYKPGGVAVRHTQTVYARLQAGCGRRCCWLRQLASLLQAHGAPQHACTRVSPMSGDAERARLQPRRRVQGCDWHGALGTRRHMQSCPRWQDCERCHYRAEQASSHALNQTGRIMPWTTEPGMRHHKLIGMLKHNGSIWWVFDMHSMRGRTVHNAGACPVAGECSQVHMPAYCMRIHATLSHLKESQPQDVQHWRVSLGMRPLGKLLQLPVQLAPQTSDACTSPSCQVWRESWLGFGG